MKRYLILALLLVGCSHEEYSQNLTEPAIVLAMTYSPEQHGSGVGNSFSGKGIGLVVTSVDIDESYAIVFRCQHGTFVITDEKAKALFAHCRQNENVILTYREIYDIKRDSSNQITQKELKKYELLNVQEAKS